MDGWIVTGFVVVFALLGCIVRVQNRWIACQCASTRDTEMPPTPALIRTWKKEIKKHTYGSATFRSYEAQLARAGLPNYGDRYKS